VKNDPKKQYVIHKGDTVSLGTPGGGGHGDPKQRAAPALAADLAAGYVTDQAAYRG
jgi:N-methylhydantoinase B